MITDSGEIKRGKLTNLRLGELSLVDVPANSLARVMIHKRGGGDPRETMAIAKGAFDIAKYAVDMYGGQSGARSFDTILADRQEQERKWEAYHQLCPFFDALTSSVQSIAADMNLTTAAKLDMVRASVESFMEAVADEMPDVQTELTKLLLGDEATAELFASFTKEPTMAGEDFKAKFEAAEARAKQAETQVATLTAAAETATAQIAELTKRAEKAEAETAELKKGIEVAKGDESFEMDGTVIRKSEVGAGVFAVLKRQADMIEQNAFEKLAKIDIPHLPGTDVAKASVLKAVAGIKDKDIREEVTKMLKAGSAAMAKRMTAKGHSQDTEIADDDAGGKATAAEAKLKALAEARQKDHPEESFHIAYTKVLATAEGQRLYEQIDEDSEVVDED